MSSITDQYIAEWAERRANATPYEAIVDLDGHHCDFGSCREQARVLTVARIVGRNVSGLGYELRGLCDRHASWAFVPTDDAGIAVGVIEV